MFRSQLSRIAAILIVSMIVTSTVFAASLSNAWPSAGHDPQNSRWQNAETLISPSNVGSLQVKWQFATTGDVSATPAVDGKNVYFPDWGGMLYAANQTTGAQVWSHKISDYTGVAGDWARATPAVFGNMLIFGTQSVFGSPAHIVAVSKQTGALIWVTQADSHPASIVTQGAVVDGSDGIVYVGVASSEEGDAAFIPNYPCCSFRGSVMALNASNGKILWKTYTVPAGYSGGAVWGSTAVIDQKRGSLYVGTGNNYSLPQSVYDCVSNNNTLQSCIATDDYFDSVMSLDLMTGAVNWVMKAMPSDAWNVDCFFGGSNCPASAGPDYDFGQGPTLYTAQMSGGGSRQLLGEGEKSGDYWALDPSTGAVVWKTNVGPGGTLGGLEWGSATDGNRIYTAVSNWEPAPALLKPWNLKNGQTTYGGGWSALDAATGKILWQTPDPMGIAGGANPNGAFDPGYVSLADGVVFGCSLEPTQGSMYAMDAATGNILWSFASGASCNSGASVSGGMVFWGTGYHLFGSSKHVLYAFGLP